MEAHNAKNPLELTGLCNLPLAFVISKEPLKLLILCKRPSLLVNPLNSLIVNFHINNNKQLQ